MHNKQVLSLILTIGLPFLSGTIIYAEGTHDLSGYSDSELIALLAEVQSKLAARRIEQPARLTAGTYIGGRDISVGRYILAAGTEDKHEIISLRPVNDPADHYPSKLYEHNMGDDVY